MLTGTYGPILENEVYGRRTTRELHTNLPKTINQCAPHTSVSELGRAGRVWRSNGFSEEKKKGSGKKDGWKKTSRGRPGQTGSMMTTKQVHSRDGAWIGMDGGM